MLAIVAALASLAPAFMGSAPVELAAKKDIVMIVADDIGLDRVGVYQAHPAPGRTPNIDRVDFASLRAVCRGTTALRKGDAGASTPWYVS